MRLTVRADADIISLMLLISYQYYKTITMALGNLLYRRKFAPLGRAGHRH